MAESEPVTWLAAVALVIGTVRLSRLVAKDDITKTPRMWATGVSDAGWPDLAAIVQDVLDQGADPWEPGAITPALPVGPVRFRFGELVRCPWCNSFWLGLAAVLAYQAWPHGTLVLMIALSGSEAAGLVAKKLDTED